MLILKSNHVSNSGPWMSELDYSLQVEHGGVHGPGNDQDKWLLYTQWPIKCAPAFVVLCFSFGLLRLLVN